MRNKFQQTILTGFVLLFVLPTVQLRAEISSANPARQALLFRNGDILFGNLESISHDKSVIWRRSDVAQPIEFSPTNLSEIQFPSAKKTALNATNACRVQLNNDDSLEGKLLQLDSEKIILETSFAGKVVFPRQVVRAIEPLPPERELIFTGPSGLDGWTLGKVTAIAAGEAGDWKYTNGAFYATRSASIARDLKLPDVAKIEFDLAWKGMLQAAIALYTSYMQPINLANKDTEPDFGGFYSLQINSFVSTLMPVRKNAPLKYMEQIPVPTFSQKNRAHIEIRANKPKNSIALFVDDTLVKEWIDTEDFAGSGTGMRFVHQGQGAIKMSNLRIAEWNGKMESASTNPPSLKEDLAKLLNGDKVSGTLETFRDGKFKFSMSNTKLDVPFERVSEIFFMRQTNEPVAETKSNIRAFFSGGGSVTFRVESWEKEGVATASPNFGRATFVPTAFDRIQLHPNLEKTSERFPPVKSESQ
ncbi:MAG: hypothetical protein ABIR24_08840 [Verrucomicrobiota bacterium]